MRFLLQRDEWDGLPTYGISRSFALLLSVGARAVILDDDIVCEAIRSPLPNTGVQFGSVGSREAVFYSNHEDLAAHTRRLPDNPITLARTPVGHATRRRSFVFTAWRFTRRGVGWSQWCLHADTHGQLKNNKKPSAVPGAIRAPAMVIGFLR